MTFFLEDLSNASEEKQKEQIDKSMKSGFLFWIIASVIIISCFTIWIILGF